MTLSSAAFQSGPDPLEGGFVKEDSRDIGSGEPPHRAGASSLLASVFCLTRLRIPARGREHVPIAKCSGHWQRQ